MYYEASTKGRPGPKKAVGCLHQVIAIHSKPEPISYWLEKLIIKNNWEPNMVLVQEKAERWATPALAMIENYISSPDKFGRPYLYIQNSSSREHIQGAGYIEGNEDLETKKHKERRQNIYKVWDQIKSLTDKEFEVFSRKIIEELGAQETKTTQYSADEGIDFFGKLLLQAHLLTDDLNPTVQRQLAIWIIGQSKHYRAIKVSTPDIRELVGSVELARGKAYSAIYPEEKFADLDIRVCDPIFQLFFTTGDISADGWRLLFHSGVIGMDGLMLSAFLCDRGIAMPRNRFDATAFVRWLG